MNLAILRRPGYGRLFSALAISSLGDQLLFIVLSLWVKTLTGSNGLAGLTFFFMMVPSLFGPALGVLIDRVRRRPCAVWGNLASALIVLPLLAVRTASDVWLIWTVAFLYGVSQVVLPAAHTGLAKELLPPDELVDANGLLTTISHVFRLFGPLAGAGLFAAAGGGPVALLDAASFVVAAVLIAGIRILEDAPAPTASHLGEEVLAGLRFLAGDPLLGRLLLGYCAANLVLGFVESAIFSVLDFFGMPAAFLGVVLTVQGVGAVIGGLLSAGFCKRFGEVAVVVGSLALLAAALGVVAGVPIFAVAMGAVVAAGFALPPLMVAFNTLVQTRTPQEVFGRVSTAVGLANGVPYAISVALGALLVTLLSYQAIFAITAGVTLAAAGYLAFALAGDGRRGEAAASEA